MPNNSQSRRRVLVIAYHFPPNASSGTFRTLKFVKYLPQFGWIPVVLTVDPRHEQIEPMDPALVQQVPEGVPVIRTYAWSPAKFRKKRTDTAPNTQSAGNVSANKTSQPSWRKRLTTVILKLIKFPDRCSGWYPFAVWNGWLAIRRYKIDMIFSSGPPFTGTLVGLTLKLLTGKPLVSDFRDPWGEKTYGRGEDNLPLSRQARWAQALKQKIFANSKCIINVSTDLTAKGQASVSRDLQSKFVTIYNGFDPNDFPLLPPRASDGKFRIVYTGCFYAGMREPRQFLLAMQKLADRHPQEFEQIEVWFVGAMAWIEANAAWCASLGLGEHAQFKPFVPHNESLKLLGESDLLLTIGSMKKADTGNLPAKIFEYAATSRPIIALVHEGESAQFIRGYGIGRLADPEDPEAIATTLLEMYREIRAGTFPTEPNVAFLRQYDRRELTRQLAEAFDTVTARVTTHD